ncbi:MAG: plasmid mobilization relaxosome protein MobC [Planctomycetota bacterium]
MAQTATQAKGPGGRPPKAPAERRTDSLHADCTIADKIYVRDQAKLAGLTLSEYIRRRCLDHQVTAKTTRADARLVHELNAIGVNLNQLARLGNSGWMGDRGGELDELSRRLSDVLDRVLEELG